MASLTNKVALITGATAGIGFAIAEAAGAIGARVMIHGREAREAHAAAERLRHQGCDAEGVGGDLASAEVCRGIVRATIQWGEGIDVLVNNAGNTARGRLEDASVEFWDAMMAVNVRAPFICLQEALGPMRARGGGSVVNIGSINAYIGAPNLGPYSVSKGALMTLTRNAAAALGRYGIRVNQLNVGWTLTEGEDQVQRASGKEAGWVAQATALLPSGRLLTPREIARAAIYFASDESAVVSGCVMDVEQYPVGALAEF